MKLGFVSAILDGWTFEEMIDTASEMGFSCVEVACWPQGKAERRYAGVSHIDTDNLSDKKAAYILNYCKARKVEISSLAYYPNTLDGNLEKRASVVAHLKNVIRASHKLGVNMVTTFIGRDQTKSVEQNLELVKEGWPPIIALAGRTEPDDHAADLAPRFRDSALPESGHQLRSLPLRLAADRLCEAALRVQKQDFPRTL